MYKPCVSLIVVYIQHLIEDSELQRFILTKLFLFVYKAKKDGESFIDCI